MIVLCHGVFDVLHYGHLVYLQEARRLASKLIVSVTADEFVNKGLGRPIFNEDQRLAMVAALSIVDDALLNFAPDAVYLIRVLRPMIYAKGPDYERPTEGLLREKQAVESVGGQLVILHPEVTFSTTDIITGALLQRRSA